MPYRRVEEAPDWDTLIHQRVRIYRNLGNGKLTLQGKIKGSGWRVSGCTETCWLSDVIFTINWGKYRWIKEQSRRTVYAWAEGTLLAPAVADEIHLPIPLGCNPFIQPEFFDKRTGKPLNSSCAALGAIANQVFVSADALPIEQTQQRSILQSLDEALAGLPLMHWQGVAA